MSTPKLARFLVVDDDPVIGTSFDRVLSGKGYAVVTAHDGEEALRKIAAEDYDAVFTDIRMPGIDGIAVAEQIRAQRPWLPVLIVSGYANDDNSLRAQAAGVSAILHKPLSPQMIEDGARQALREQSAMALVKARAAPPVADAPVAQASGLPHRALAAFRNLQPSGLQAALLAPVVSLAFVLLFPLIGLAMMVAVPLWHFAKWLMARPTTEFRRWSRDVALFFAAPFLGLAYIVALPFVVLGYIAALLGQFAWKGCKALLVRHGAA